MRAFLVPAALVVVLAVIFQLVISRRTHQGWGQLRAGMQADLRRGGMQPLLRARLVALRVSVAEPDDTETAAALAYAGARLAQAYALPFDREAEVVVGRGGDSPLVAAARAFLDLHQGRRESALKAATAGGTGVESYLALAAARSWSGDLVGAARVLEAARVLGPELTDGQVAWSEVRLDLGDANAARETLEGVLRASPDDTAARLLLAEALDALGRSPSAVEREELTAGCTRDELISPTLRAGCALERAGRFRLGGNRARSLAEARAAGAPPEPRVLGRTAQLLAQLGAVDEADARLGTARALGDPRMPALAWARAALALGRSEPTVLSPTLPLDGSVTRVLSARAALASGGAGAIEEWQRRHPLPGHALDDPELRPLLVSTSDNGPLASYVAGLRARLDGRLITAADKLHAALDGHADACRAAGEYVAAVRALGTPLDLAALEPLRHENARCVHLTAEALAAPVPQPPGRQMPKQRRR